MTPEERKAIAVRQPYWEHRFAMCDKIYPRCCAYHQGFDAALGLLVLNCLHEPRCPGDLLYAIEG